VIARRLPELERDGKVERRIDKTTGKYREGVNGVAWWLKTRGDA
jgi:DNA-binding HxlR family transcriptional regulator